MTDSSLAAWIERYDAKAPEPFQRDARFGLYYLPARGFAEVGSVGSLCVIWQLAGDARFWKEKVSEAARQAGYPRCGTLCIRPEIRAYIRLFGYGIERTEETKDGHTRYHCRHKTTGKARLVSPAFTYKRTGQPAYFVTWEP